VVIAPALMHIRAAVVLTMAAVAVIVAVVAVVVVPFFAIVVMMALGAIEAGGPFRFLGVSVAVCYLYQLTDGHGPLAV